MIMSHTTANAGVHSRRRQFRFTPAQTEAVARPRMCETRSPAIITYSAPRPPKSDAGMDKMRYSLLSAIQLGDAELFNR